MSLTYSDLYIRKTPENTLFSFWLYTRKSKKGWNLNSNATVFSKYISFCIFMNDLIFLAYHRTTRFVILVQWSHNYLGYFKWIFNYEGSPQIGFFPQENLSKRKILKKGMNIISFCSQMKDWAMMHGYWKFLPIFS